MEVRSQWEVQCASAFKRWMEQSGETKKSISMGDSVLVRIAMWDAWREAWLLSIEELQDDG